MPATVVVLGAGFGGLELASGLSSELGDAVEVTLIDKSDSFVFGYQKLDVLFGHKSTGEVRNYYKDIVKPGVTFRQEVIESIDPASRTVFTSGGTYTADYLVIALGADYDMAATPGLAEGFAHEFYTVEGAERARSVVDSFEGGTVIVGILGPTLKCPPAPFETAFMMDELLKAKGLRDASSVRVVSPLPAPIPISQEASAGVLAGCAEHGVAFTSGTTFAGLERGVATTGDGQTLEFDLFLAIPVHCAPEVVAKSGLTEADGWIAVDAGTLETKFPGVYAVGDVASVPVPRAGVFAEGEAAVVARNLVSVIRGEDPVARYAAEAACYLDWGDGRMARVDVKFSGGSPSARFAQPTAEITQEKVAFGADRRKRWGFTA